MLKRPGLSACSSARRDPSLPSQRKFLQDRSFREMEAAAIPKKKIRVLIADDHRLFAEALEAILATDQRFDVVGKAHDGEEAVRLAGTHKPDVVLMDIAMPNVDGVEATR